MIMARYTPHHWVLLTYAVALVLIFVNPVTTHPVGTSQLAKTGDLEDLETRGVRETPGKEENRGIQNEYILPPTQMRSTSERLSQRDPSSDESIVSILVPVVPVSDYTPHSHDHPTTDKQDVSILESNSVPQRLEQYGELFNNQEQDRDEFLEPDTESYSSSTWLISPTHYISFFSYRISLPFLKYAPKCLPRFPLPGIFTTVVLLLVLVWVAILTIALVELGNYLWIKRRDPRLAVKSDNVVSDSMSSGSEGEKIPLRVIAVPGSEMSEVCVDNASLINDYTSDSGSDSEPDVDDYRIF